jgi:thiol-disulfide isomerase/thioredoxin
MKRIRIFGGGLMMIAISLMITSCNPVPVPTVVATLSTPQETKQAIHDSKAPLTLVHVWATWCQPCREEFPELMHVYRDYHKRGLELKLVSADDPDDLATVESFLHEQGSPVGSLVSTELSQSFVELFSSAWSGALPASFFFDDQGRLVEEFYGKRSYEEFAATIERLLKP